MKNLNNKKKMLNRTCYIQWKDAVRFVLHQHT